MTVDITIRVPDDLGRELDQYRDRLPELLERGLRDLQLETTADEVSADDIIAVLASQPTPQQVLAIRPSDQMQARASDLLARSKSEGLSRMEELELDRYLYLEHLVRLAKVRAFEQITPSE
jgi:hypothetical protein